MTIKYFATLRDITKLHEEYWTTPVDTLEELIRYLCGKYGQSFKKWVTDENGGHGSLCIFLINGNDYRSLNGLQTKLNKDDTISLFPPLAGG